MASDDAQPWWLDPAEYEDARDIDDLFYVDDANSTTPVAPKRSSPSSSQDQRVVTSRSKSRSTEHNEPTQSTPSSPPRKSLRDFATMVKSKLPSPPRHKVSDMSADDRRDGDPSNKRSLSDTLTASISTLGASVSKLGRKLQPKRTTSTLSSTETRSNSGRSNGTEGSYRKYSVKELVQSLGQDNVEVPPALERRVRDFKFAQGKRRERHGEKKPWGIFGLYAHLSDIRADLEWAEDAAWRRQQGEPYLSWTDFEKSRDQGLHNRPWFTYSVVVLCTIMLLVTFGVNGWKIEPLNVNPLIGPSSETLVKCGARQSNLIVNEGEWYRLFTPLVLHAGLVHYVINMLAMWYIGGAVEQSHGFASAAVLFIIPAVGGNILSAICLPQYISVGASGGIFGLIGGCVADVSINWNLLFLRTTTDEDTRWRHVMVLFWLAFDAVVNCMIGFTPFVDNFTHLGGFMYGLCCGLSTIERLAVGFFGLSSSSGTGGNIKNNLMRFLGVIISVVAVMVTTVILVQSDGVSSPCHGCRYISCVPFPFRSDQKWWYCDDCDFVTADLFMDDSGLYEEIDLQCPNGDVAEIVIAEDNHTSKEKVRRDLPSYCRANCENVFISNDKSKKGD